MSRQESYYNNLRQSLRHMPVNEVSREEAHTRRNRIYLTPKPIQLPTQQDQRSTHQHNLLDIITGSKKIINRFTKRSPTNKDSVDEERVQQDIKAVVAVVI